MLWQISFDLQCSKLAIHPTLYTFVYDLIMTPINFHSKRVNVYWVNCFIYVKCPNNEDFLCYWNHVYILANFHNPWKIHFFFIFRDFGESSLFSVKKKLLLICGGSDDISLSTDSYVVHFEQVILVSSSGQASSSSILHQKSITVPVVKTTSSLGGTHNQKSSNILPNSGGSSHANLGNIVTMATSMSSNAPASKCNTHIVTCTMYLESLVQCLSLVLEVKRFKYSLSNLHLYNFRFFIHSCHIIHYDLFNTNGQHPETSPQDSS